MCIRKKGVRSLKKSKTKQSKIHRNTYLNKTSKLAFFQVLILFSINYWWKSLKKLFNQSLTKIYFWLFFLSTSKWLIDLLNMINFSFGLFLLVIFKDWLLETVIKGLPEKCFIQILEHLIRFYQILLVIWVWKGCGPYTRNSTERGLTSLNVRKEVFIAATHAN